MRFLTRAQLAKAVTAPVPGALLFAGSPAEYGVPLDAAEVEAMQSLSRRSLEKAGLAKNDRVLLAVNRDGSPAVGLLAQAAASLGTSVAVTPPNGRLRLLSTIRALKPNVLVTTPCGAADFLARLYMEFNVDPVELDLTKIVLVGEIASQGVKKRVAKEFEAELSELYCDPVFGAALAVRRGSGAWTVADQSVLALGLVGTDEIVDEDIAGDGELLLRPTWSAALADTAIRTGQVIEGDAGDAGLFNHTVGDHVLARGQFVSIPLLRKQLALIDGISHWTLTIDRGDRTLDNLLLTIAFDRETLVTNPMWKGRIQQAISAVTPLQVEIKTELVSADAAAAKEAVNDLRGHHLGIVRT
jgi:phenylacetate-CoA ligase